MNHFAKLSHDLPISPSSHTHTHTHMHTLSAHPAGIEYVSSAARCPVGQLLCVALTQLLPPGALAIGCDSEGAPKVDNQVGA